MTFKDRGGKAAITGRDFIRGCSSVSGVYGVERLSRSREADLLIMEDRLLDVRECTEVLPTAKSGERTKGTRNVEEEEEQTEVSRNKVELGKQAIKFKNEANVEKKAKVSTRVQAEEKADIERNVAEVGSTIGVMSSEHTITHTLAYKRERRSRLQLKHVKKRSSSPVKDSTVEIKHKNKNEFALTRVAAPTKPHEVEKAPMTIDQLVDEGFSRSVSASKLVPRESDIESVNISNSSIQADEANNDAGFREEFGGGVKNASSLTDGLLESRETISFDDSSLQHASLEEEAEQQQKPCSARVECNAISQASSIKRTSKSMPEVTKSAAEDISEDSSNDYKNRTSRSCGTRTKRSHLTISSGEFEEFGNIQESSGSEDNIVMVPSTPQEKAARRLAREKQLKNMRAREMAETRRERALRRRRRMNGEDEESDSRLEPKTWKKIKWKDDNELVSVFQYSPAEESSDSSSVS